MGLMSASGVPPAVGLLGIVYEKPSKRKNAAFACFSAGNPLGFVFGTIFSGIATSLFSWRASFWLLAIIYLCFSIIAFFTVPKDFTDKEPLNMETFKRFDPVGNLCTIAGVGMFSAALSLGSTAPQGWRTGYVLALLIVGVLLMAGFVVWENIYKYPLVPMVRLKSRLPCETFADDSFAACREYGRIETFPWYSPFSSWVSWHSQSHRSSLPCSSRWSGASLRLK